MQHSGRERKREREREREERERRERRREHVRDYQKGWLEEKDERESEGQEKERKSQISTDLYASSHTQALTSVDRSLFRILTRPTLSFHRWMAGR